MAETKKGAKEIKIGKGRFFAIIFAVFTFVVMFANWFKYEVMSESFGFSIFHSDMFDLNTCLGLAKVFAIIALVIGLLYIIALVIDFKKFIPGLKKFKFGFDRLFALVYYGFYGLALLFNIIGCIATDGVVPTVRIIFLFVLIVGIILHFAIPAIHKFVAKNVTLVIE